MGIRIVYAEDKTSIVRVAENDNSTRRMVWSMIEEKWFEVVRELLRRYDSVTPLTDAEKQAVYYVICSVQLVFIAWSGDEHAEMAKMNREMLAFIMQNKARISTII